MSRPALVNSNLPLLSVLPSSLREATAIEIYSDRLHAIKNCFETLAANITDERRELKWMLEIVTSLRNLAPTSIDLLKLLPQRPAMLARLLLRATDGNERLAVWQLERELPFVWLALPMACWKTAMSSEYEAIFNALQSVSNSEAISIAGQHIQLCITAVANIEPALAVVLRIAAGGVGQSFDLTILKGFATAHIQNRYYLEELHPTKVTQTPSMLPNLLARHGLAIPAEFNFDIHTFEELLVPAVLAASALEKLVLDPEILLIVRRGYRVAPHYVTAAYPLFLAFYKRSSN